VIAYLDSPRRRSSSSVARWSSCGHALRATDAWHLAVAEITVGPRLEPGEQRAFASHDEARRTVAQEPGFTPR
jgi:hypothetical protein